jgi:hypothetical protein
MSVNSICITVGYTQGQDPSKLSTRFGGQGVHSTEERASRFAFTVQVVPTYLKICCSAPALIVLSGNDA